MQFLVYLFIHLLKIVKMDDLKFNRSYGVQAVLFDTEISPFSPVIGDVERKVSFDEDGKEIVSFPEVDYKKLQASRGTVDNWSLDEMLKAGVDPGSINIHTASSVSRFEVAGVIDQLEQDVDKLFDDKSE